MEKIMRNLKIALLIITVSATSLFAIGGFGLQVGQSSFSVAETSPETGSEYITLTNSSFDGAYVIGGYLYIDAIPFIDLEVDANIRGNKYDINFENVAGSMEPIKFGWASTDVYYTLRKKVFGLSIPFLAGAKIHAGGGYNTHVSTPIADIDMITELLGGDLTNGDPSSLEDNLMDYLEENTIEATGFHFQAGLQFKLLMLDTFLNYRYTIVDDVVPDAGGFGSVNLRIGFGI
jgi:hypothetical protein